MKICGLTRRKDAETALRAGASYLGVVLVEGTSRCVEPERACAVTEGLGLPVVAVTADLPAEAVAAAAEVVGASVLQLHGGEDEETITRLRELGSWRIWKALRVRSPEEARAGIVRFREVVDGLLLEGWHPRLRGGAGAVFPWERIAPLREEVPPTVEFVVAGGLTPGNVEEAVRVLRPDVVDVSSGVERAPGVKDPERIAAFVRNARGRRGAR